LCAVKCIRSITIITVITIIITIEIVVAGNARIVAEKLRFWFVKLQIRQDFVAIAEKEFLPKSNSPIVPLVRDYANEGNYIFYTARKTTI
jgi:hypothetical protein